MAEDRVLEGTIEPGFETVADLVEQQLTEGGGAGAAVYHRGRPVVDVWGGIADTETGRPWERDTIVMAFSTSKGFVATALHMCVDRGLLDHDDLVATHWPEFAAGGKDEITVRHVLCHEAGLYDTDAIVAEPGDILDWGTMVAALEGAEPAFEPGTATAYHAVTFGFIVGEVVRRVSGRGISEFIAEEIVGPLELTGAFVGTPDEELDRVAPISMPEDFAEVMGSTGGGRSSLLEVAEAMGLEVHPEITRAAFGAGALRELAGTPEALRHPIPSFNGTFDARSVARLYAALAAGGTLDGVRLLGPETLARATEVQSTRPDLAVVFPMRWRLGYHGVLTTVEAPPRAFGHVGLGGSGGWAEPDRELAVAMVTNRLGTNLIGDDRLMAIGGAAITCADALG